MFVSSSASTRAENLRIPDRALTDRNVEVAWRAAEQVGPLDLGRALRLTVVLGEDEAAYFPADRAPLARPLHSGGATHR
jgi:hypothetical protein